MEQSQAQRRLVKSPPELWAELSSEDSLGRHLAEFGEIRITRVEPETTVAWEGDRASGTVQISPTGWGTQVTLTATAVSEPVVAESQAVEPVVAEVEVVEPAEPVVAEPQVIEPPEPVVAEPQVVEPVEPVTPVPAPVAMISLREPDPPAPSATTEPDAAPRGFFARFFRRPAPPSPPPEPFEVDPPLTKAEIPAPPAPDPGPPTPGPDPTPPGPGLPDPVPTPQPVPDPVPPGPGPDPSPPAIETPLQPPQAAGCEAGPAALAIDPERTVAILTEVLDDLGAAHHRPFSRG